MSTTTPNYRRAEPNIYQRFDRFYVYLMRVGKRSFIGSFDSLDEARIQRDLHAQANPPRKPWALANVGRTKKTRKDYYLEHKAKGQCTSCSDKAVPGRCLCMGCAYVQKVKREGRMRA